MCLADGPVMKPRILGLTISVLMIAAPVFAAQKPKSTQPKPHAVTKTVVKPQAASHGKSSVGKSSVKVQAKSSVKPVKVKSTVKVQAKSAPTSTKTTMKTSKKGTTTTTTAYAPVPGTTVTLSPVQQKLQKNTNLAAKLRSRLPAGTDLMTASAGFRNLGGFVSAVNASYNHNLPFDGLKQRIVYEGMSLGQAMQDMRSTDALVRRR